jgi:hypothetical protein
MMMETNEVFKDYKTDPYDFFILDSKMMGRVEILKAFPYTIYSGKVRVKGNENPMRIEVQNERMPM